MFPLEAEGSLNITCLVTNVARGAGGGQTVVWRHRGGQRISYRSASESFGPSESINGAKDLHL